ncbi:MAG: M50 family peptidase [Acidimicrobiales bacterium]|nr:M50 family metallopeptidase [Hyphomonadaceae bacterium]RZV44810.1 MAG: M50 family peptidase [Acidimicrobiales bacterium]
MSPQPTDDHWILLSIGLIAMVFRLGFSFACAAFIVLGADATSQAETISGANQIGPVIAIFVLAFVLNFIQVFIHEMGHALAAWKVGRRVHMICVGILGYAPDLKQIMRIKIPANAEYAGYVQVSPTWPDLSHDKSIWVSLGGPLATGLVGVLILAAGALLTPATDPLTSSIDTPSYPITVLWLGGFFILDAVANLIPLRWTLGGGSDGLHILGYLRKDGWTADLWAKVRLETANLSTELVSDAEWEHLEPMVGAPFNSKVFNELLDKASAQRGGA